MIDQLLTNNLLPDPLIRIGIRHLLKQRLKEERKGDFEEEQIHLMKLICELKKSPIAIHTAEANQQHYEVPTAFYKRCLGKNLKYSCAYFKTGNETLDEAEEKMLELTIERAELKDGQDILELGCGWGSLSLYMAKKFPQSRIIGISNSLTQKEYIDNEAKIRGLKNVNIITADMNTFSTAIKFDRVVSVEMFEHMRNYQLLMNRVASFLNPEGKLFVHIFTHRKYTYYYRVKNGNDWLAKYFFTGGIMPSDDLLLYFQDDLKLLDHWHINGKHYSKTSEYWLSNMDKRKSEIMPLFAETYGKDQAAKWWVYWRVFFMACSELWKYRNGEEWMVSHYLFQKKT